MEFNQKFDKAPILALQDGKFDSIFLLSLSPWLVDLDKQYQVWDSNQWEGIGVYPYSSGKLQAAEHFSKCGSLSERQFVP